MINENTLIQSSWKLLKSQEKIFLICSSSMPSYRHLDELYLFTPVVGISTQSRSHLWSELGSVHPKKVCAQGRRFAHQKIYIMSLIKTSASELLVWYIKVKSEWLIKAEMFTTRLIAIFKRGCLRFRWFISSWVLISHGK